MTDDRTLLILVDPDETTRTFLADNLAADGYEVAAAATGHDALQLTDRQRLDAAVIATTVNQPAPGELIAALRHRHADLPIIALASSGSTGALWDPRSVDGTIRKPFSYPEVRRVLAERLAARPRQRSLGPLEISPDDRVTLRGKPIALTRQELALLKALASQPACVLTKERLLHDVSAFRRATTRRLDSTAVTLRRKLRRTDDDRWIKWLWGHGFQLHDGPIPPA